MFGLAMDNNPEDEEKGERRYGVERRKSDRSIDNVCHRRTFLIASGCKKKYGDDGKFPNSKLDQERKNDASARRIYIPPLNLLFSQVPANLTN